MNPPDSSWPVVPFPELLVQLLLKGSLLLTGVGALVLLVLLVRDRRKKQIW